MKCLLLLVVCGFCSALPLQGLHGEDLQLFQNYTQNLHHPDELIFGGANAKQGQWPWQAFLILKSPAGGTFICGGSLITSTHVLTAAHCTENLQSGIVLLGTVVLKDVQRTTGVQIKKIQSFKREPHYDGEGSVYDDLAVITLNTEVQLTDVVKLVKIVKDDSKVLNVPTDIVSGFGTYDFDADEEPLTSETLRYVEVDHIDHDWCTKRWARASGNQVKIIDTQICAGSKGKGSGPGDSGGPLHANVDGEWIQIGLVSFGVKGYPQIMDQSSFPSVYTRVASYCSFIEGETQGDFKCL
ncbi:hypothetical protein L596_030474 [Steinernema carpocapsae]|uniref:Peptidase S1 domain-containing protein n=1 Tax=Steinernema carpocapsae TaxID=34508 RepID=A0A4U5LPH5_STECR|nr:hypothetical protein L596_030474 [Steinernema carpocapsae]